MHAPANVVDDTPERVRRAGPGSAIVDFALVSGLLTLLFVAVIQIAVVVHVRNTSEVPTGRSALVALPSVEAVSEIANECGWLTSRHGCAGELGQIAEAPLPGRSGIHESWMWLFSPR